jgi:hypothetical protein
MHPSMRAWQRLTHGLLPAGSYASLSLSLSLSRELFSFASNASWNVYAAYFQCWCGFAVQLASAFSPMGNSKWMSRRGRKGPAIYGFSRYPSDNHAWVFPKCDINWLLSILGLKDLNGSQVMCIIFSISRHVYIPLRSPATAEIWPRN